MGDHMSTMESISGLLSSMETNLEAGLKMVILLFFLTSLNEFAPMMASAHMLQDIMPT